MSGDPKQAASQPASAVQSEYEDTAEPSAVQPGPEAMQPTELDTASQVQTQPEPSKGGIFAVPQAIAAKATASPHK
jgi:hypothetical protein